MVSISMNPVVFDVLSLRVANIDYYILHQILLKKKRNIYYLLKHEASDVQSQFLINSHIKMSDFKISQAEA